MRKEEGCSVERHPFHFLVNKQGQGQGGNDNEQTRAEGVEQGILESNPEVLVLHQPDIIAQSGPFHRIIAVPFREAEPERHHARNGNEQQETQQIRQEEKIGCSRLRMHHPLPQGRFPAFCQAGFLRSRYAFIQRRHVITSPFLIY